MKGLKKLALATAVAAAPFAQAEMTAMDDAFLGEMTGQAGVTIELDTAITIESFVYTDEDGKANGEGSLTMKGIAFGGGLVGGSTSSVHDERLDDFKIDIDVDETDGLVIHLGGTDSKNGLVGVNPVDFGLSIDSVTSSGIEADSTIASDIKIAGNLGPIDVRINNNNVDAKNLIDVQAYFEVTSGSLDVDVIGMGISNLKVGQNSSPIFSGDYKQEVVQAVGLNAGGTDDADIINTARAAGYTAATPATGGTAAENAAADELVVTAILAAVVNGAPEAAIREAAGETPTVPATGTNIVSVAVGKIMADTGLNASDAQDAFDAKVVGTHPVTGDPVTMADLADDDARASAYLTGLNTATNAQNATNMAFVHMTIGSGDASYSNLTEGDVTVQNALIVNLEDFNIDVSMDISMGETVTFEADGITVASRTARSLGNIAINDLNMSGTTLKIYGH